LVDLYSTARRVVFINKKRELEEQREQHQSDYMGSADDSAADFSPVDLTSEFSIDPTLLLGPTLQTSRVRYWQVLPGRTHPEMSGRGGAEGYIFHAIRVIPTQERITARGTMSRKKRKVTDTDPSTPTIAT
jgi:tRNA (adenine-N(1)-)-methyltransferase non-catalytic subunit